MGTIVYMLFDFDNLRLADRGRILSLMGALAENDQYRFLKKAIVCDDMPGEIYVPNTPELLDRAWSNAVRAAPRYNGQYWMEFENSSGLKISFGFDPRKLKRLHLNMDKDALKLPGSAPNAAELVKVIRIINNTLAPSYGYGLFNYDVHDLQPVGAGPQGIWDYNLFGAKLVEQWNHALDGLPAAVTRFQNGGALVALSDEPFAGYREAAPHYKQAAESLGLSAVFHDG
ncbi:MAG: hypothetical protein IAE89_06340 [Anaerolineae bacterium]|nr:hypothetical protein [Anaerolineae bacterium]